MTERKDSPVKLHIGYVGKTWDGERVEITNKNETDVIFSDGGSRYWRSDGQYWSGAGEAHANSIIGPWEEPQQETEYEVGKWYGWNGGECPVHPETVVEIVTETGVQATRPASDVIWRETVYSVLCFRVVTPYVGPAKPREWWIGNNDGFAHDSLESVLSDPLTDKHGYVHVREVIE